MELQKEERLRSLSADAMNHVRGNPTGASQESATERVVAPISPINTGLCKQRLDVGNGGGNARYPYQRRHRVGELGVLPGQHADAGHAGRSRAGHVLVRAVTGEQRLLGGHAKSEERSPEGSRVWFAVPPAQLVREDDDVEGVAESQGYGASPAGCPGRRR